MIDDQCKAKTPDVIYDETYKPQREIAKQFSDESVHHIALALKGIDLSDSRCEALHDAWGEEWERRERYRIDAPRVDRVAAALREIRDGSTIGYFGQAQHVLDVLKDELLPDPWTPTPYTEQQEPPHCPKCEGSGREVIDGGVAIISRACSCASAQSESQPSVRDELKAYLLRTTKISHADAERHAHAIANICFGEEAA